MSTVSGCGIHFSRKFCCFNTFWFPWLWFEKSNFPYLDILLLFPDLERCKQQTDMWSKVSHIHLCVVTKENWKPEFSRDATLCVCSVTFFVANIHLMIPVNWGWIFSSEENHLSIKQVFLLWSRRKRSLIVVFHGR